MSRRLISLVLVSAPAIAHADETIAPAPAAPAAADAPADQATTNPQAPADMSEQAISAVLGVAVGGRSTPGGLTLGGHYFYQMADQDWFDGSVTFSFGSGSPDCFRDRVNAVICDHGPADGFAAGLATGVRHFLPSIASQQFWPFARAAVGASLVRFSGDDITGIAFSLFGGVGVRASVTDAIAITAQADLQLGLGQFSNHLGGEPLLGVAVSAGAEFRL